MVYTRSHLMANAGPKPMISHTVGAFSLWHTNCELVSEGGSRIS